MEPTERDTIADESNIRRNRSDPTQRKFKYKPPSDRSVNPLKKRQRDLTRLLGHSDSLPADVRIGYERELASCRHDIQIAQDKLRRNQMIKKYHMVRFFERQKATRFLRQVKRQLANAPEPQEKKELEAEVYNCEVDLNYTMFFPLQKIYTSLYANVKTATGKREKESTADRSHPMWKTVEDAMKHGTLQALREGRARPSAQPLVNKPLSAPKQTNKMNDATNKVPVRKQAVRKINTAGHVSTSALETSGTAPNRRTRRKQAAVNGAIRIQKDSDDDESGGAFFES